MTAGSASALLDHAVAEALARVQAALPGAMAGPVLAPAGIGALGTAPRLSPLRDISRPASLAVRPVLPRRVSGRARLVPTAPGMDMVAPRLGRRRVADHPAVFACREEHPAKGPSS